jgi:nitrite reductase (NO-forming)
MLSDDVELPGIRAPRGLTVTRLIALALGLVSVLLLVTGLRVLGLEDRYATLTAASEAEPPEQRPQVRARLVLTEFGIEADVTEIPPWATITFDVINSGDLPHDAAVGDAATPILESGESASFTVDVGGSGEVEIVCTVPGHVAAGMTLVLPIGAGDAQGADGSGDQAPASADEAAAYQGPKPGLVRRDPAAPASPHGTVHDVVWVVEEKVVQVAEDVWQEVWTFDGQVPGPTLRLRVGDTLNLTLQNPADARVAHSVDFHASQVAWNDEMRSLQPGEELLYSFEATHAGVFMYHCGTAPALHHIGNGMHGMVIVEPADGLAPVDHELFFVQHEYYLGPQGAPGDLTRMSESAAAPDLVVFNGVADQYLHAPIEVGVGERVRAWVLNNGPSADSSFHVVGTIFDTVVKEGVALRRDNSGRWGSQALDLAPAQGGYVEFSLAEDGLYPIVTHAFNHVGRGALGLFKAGTGGPAAASGH